MRRTGARRLPSAVVRLSATFAVFLVAVYGFASAYSLDRGAAGPLSENAFKALQLVVGVFPQDLAGKSLPWSLQGARWALPLLTLWTVWEAAWAQARNPVRLRWVRRRGEHLVVAGDAALAGPAVVAERRAGAPVLLWTDGTDAAWIARAADLGVPHLAITETDDGALALGLDRARAVLLLGGDDARNISLAVQTGGAAQAVRPPGDPLPLLVRIEDTDLREPAEQRLDRLVDRRTVRPRLVSIADLLARQLFVERPLDGFVRPGEAARIVVLVGFTPLLERYALRLLAGGHFSDGTKPRMIVLDPAAERCAAIFRARRPQAEALSPILFEAAPADEPALLGGVLRDVAARHGAPVAVLIDGPNDGRSLALAEAANAAFARAGLIAPPIHTRLARCPDGQTAPMIVPFGEVATLAEPERLLQERHDGLARSVHDFYLQGQFDDGRVLGTHGSLHEWEDLPERVRDDNRLVADCYRLKLRDIGARLREGGAERGSEAVALRFERDEIEILARAEHDRWMAAKHVDGWSHGEVRDDRARRHPDLVPYDALDERIRDLDREQVRLMSRLLPLTGGTALRVLTIAVDAGESGGDVARAVPALIAALAEHYPDRLPLLRGRFEMPGSRAALTAALAAGAGIQLLLTEPVDTIIDALPRVEAVAARALVRRADTLFALASSGAAPPAPDMSLVGEGADAGGEPIVRVTANGTIAAAPWLA